MKNLTKGLFVIIFFSLVFSLYSGLYADANKCKEVELKCAVCGTDISRDAAKIKTEHKGKTYYFASEKCKAEFEKNPEEYAKTCNQNAFYVCPEKECDYRSDNPGKCPTCGKELKKVECKNEHNVFYVCPMKQCNYKSDDPGKCPKCGMNLKKVTTCPYAYMHGHNQHTMH
jgi:YHS domain-containing protein